MRFAYLASSRATCARKSVGAVIVKNNKIVSTGYNGQPHGQPHCEGEEFCNKDGKGCQNTIHAETNALLFASMKDMNGAEIYITMTPCEKCLDYIANCGIKKIYYNEVYRVPTSLDKAKRIGIEMIHVELPDSDLQYFGSIAYKVMQKKQVCDFCGETP